MPPPVTISDTALCKHYLVTQRKFTSKVTGKVIFVNGDPSCNIKNVIHSIACTNVKMNA